MIIPASEAQCASREHIKVNVSEGDQVGAGDVLIVMEAMKMETDIKAEQDGTVNSVHVKEGDAVSVDDELVTLG